MQSSRSNPTLQGRSDELAAAFQFDLRDMLVAFVLVASVLATFGPGAILFAAWLLALIACIRVMRCTPHPLARIGLFILMSLALVCLLIPVFPHPGDGALRTYCHSKLHNIGIALHNYDVYDALKRFPAAHAADEDGKPMHSWRIQILPYIELGDLYDQYNFDESWDGPNNRKLADKMPDEFACPSDPRAGAPFTNYVAVVGPQTVWPGSKRMKEADIGDGSANTITVVEVAVADTKMHWMEPRDLAWEDVARGMNAESGPSISSRHMVGGDLLFHDEPAGAQVLFADARAHFLPAGQPPETLRALLSANGGERIDIGKLEPKYKWRVHWPHCVALTTLILSIAYLLLRRPPTPVGAKCEDAAEEEEENVT